MTPTSRAADVPPDPSPDGRVAIAAGTTGRGRGGGPCLGAPTHVPAAGGRPRSGAGPRPSARCGRGADYEEWYPTFGCSGLVVPTWPVEYGGLDVTPAVARAIEAELAPYNLGRLNPLGLNLAAPALFAHGTEEQRLRFLPPIVRNEEVWCQLFSEPGAGSDLASLAMPGRARR